MPHAFTLNIMPAYWLNGHLIIAFYMQNYSYDLLCLHFKLMQTTNPAVLVFTLIVIVAEVCCCDRLEGSEEHP